MLQTWYKGFPCTLHSVNLERLVEVVLGQCLHSRGSVLCTLYFLFFFVFLKRYTVMVSVQSLSRVRLFVTPWTAARQASLSITNSRSLMLCMYCEMIPTIKLINTSITHVITPLFLPPSLPSFCFFFFFCGENTYRFTFLADFKDTIQYH